ncbi:MAG: AAA family ATPase, partial [Planctomycetota bacterium]
MSDALIDPTQLAAARKRALDVKQGLDSILLGQEELTRLVLIALLARGHVLLEGLPGLGKTELVKGLARLLDLEFRRVQFTPDLLPGDVTGGHMLEESAGGRKLAFHAGPIFTNLLLADEINRASPKTQSALLEAMQERRVTLLGETRALPAPFFVLATQNPIELEGTYPLPEAQLDRFLFKLDVPGLPAAPIERILTERRHGRAPEPACVIDRAGFEALHAAVDRIFLPNAVANWIARVVEASHPRAAQAPAKIKSYVRWGASPRAAIAIAEAARASALIDGRPGVGFEDVRAVASAALAHRIVLDYRARLDGVRGADLVAELLGAVPEIA